MVDTMGMLLAVVVHPANVQDRGRGEIAHQQVDRTIPPPTADLG